MQRQGLQLSLTVTLMTLVVAMAACSSPTQQLQEAARSAPPVLPVSEAPPPAGTTEPTQVDAPTVAEDPVTPTPTATTVAPPSVSVPTAAQGSMTATAQPLMVLDSGYGQEGRELGYAFLVSNPNEDQAVESSRYQVAFYDADGLVVKTDSGHIELVLPGQTVGLADTVYLDEGIRAARMEVQVRAGKRVASPRLPELTAEGAIYVESWLTNRVYALVTNPYGADLQDLRVSAVLYDEDGAIIGGGFTFLSFVLAGQRAGVSLSVTSEGSVARIDIYPTVSGLTFLGNNRQPPAGVTPIRIMAQGYGQDGGGASFGLVVENPNLDHAVEDSQYLLTAFDSEGRVIATEDGYLSVLMPGEVLGVGGSLYVADGLITRTEAHVLSGKWVPAAPVPPFTSQGVVYRVGSWSNTVSGEIVNPYDRDATDLRASALLYGANDEIVGGGFTYLDFVPSNGRAAVEVSVRAGTAVARAELYATLSSFSTLE